MKTFLKTVLPFIFGKPVTTTLTKEEILKETVEYYSADPTLRSVEGKQCYYNGPNDTHCAVGRCLLPQLKEMGVKLSGNGASIKALLSHNKVDSLDELLEPKYRGHDVSFWHALQILHDSKNYWNDDAINESGLSHVERIEQGIKENTYGK